MRYQLEISEKALDQLRALPKPVRRNIGQRLELLCQDFQGDVTKLKAQGLRYRLRVANHRVLFILAGKAIQVYAVKDRKEAYD
jgi:mRNA-degrading endonuclease RelE of RelBE toxin-antitoxin system